MIVEYKGMLFNGVKKKNGICITTHKEEKVIELFEVRYDYFFKLLNFNNPGITAVYDIRFIVEYHDNIEEQTMWEVGRYWPMHKVPDIIKGEFGIVVDHDSWDESWIQYDKGAASKMIHITDCKSFTIEISHLFKNGQWLSEPQIERQAVSMADFHYLITQYRRENL